MRSREGAAQVGVSTGPARERSLLDLQQRIAACEGFDALMAELASSLGPLLPVKDRVSIVFLEPDAEWMRIHRVLPAGERPDQLPRVRVDGTPVGRVLREGVGRVVTDVRADPNITFGHASRSGIRSTISVPIRIDGAVVGVMSAGSRVAGTCTREMLRELERISEVVGPAVFAAEQALAREPDPARVGSRDRGAGLVGESAGFRSLIASARRAARSDADILITGETGTGKTALARAIHGWSARAGGPFVTVHLADLSPTVIESELFGHERGAFTGAQTHRIGRFESAQGGTIFLDELGEAPPSIQSKLLRVIQDRCFERVGGSRTIEADVRIIAATGRDLRDAIARNEFRQDLFYRLNVLRLSVPPLRDRREDLELLVESILQRIGSGPRPRQLSADAWTRLRRYSWPGNVRELESVLRRAAILEDGDRLTLEGFPEEPIEPMSSVDEEDWPTLDEHERRYILRVLERCRGVIEGPDGAAGLLGLHPSTLRSRMKRLDISARPMRAKQKRQR